MKKIEKAIFFICWGISLFLLAFGVFLFCSSFVSVAFLKQIIAGSAIVIISSINLGILSKTYTDKITSE